MWECVGRKLKGSGSPVMLIKHVSFLLAHYGLWIKVEVPPPESGPGGASFSKRASELCEGGGGGGWCDNAHKICEQHCI